MYTDDCEMTLGTMHALVADNLQGSLTPDLLLAWWKREYDKPDRAHLLSRVWSLAGVGRNGHGGIASVWSGEQTIEEQRERLSKVEYPGNAPPMRALPLAFLPEALLLQFSIDNADATHPHPKARLSSLIVALLGRAVLVDGMGTGHRLIPTLILELKRFMRIEAALEDPDILPYLTSVDSLPGPGKLYGSYESLYPKSTIETLCGAQPIWSKAEGKPREVSGLGADAMRTAGCVVYLLKWHREGAVMETLLRSLYIGGDVDSLASICLGIIGGREGLRFGENGGLPTYLLEGLEGAEYLSQVASDFGTWVNANDANKSREDRGSSEVPVPLAPAGYLRAGY